MVVCWWSGREGVGREMVGDVVQVLVLDDVDDLVGVKLLLATIG